MFRLLAEDVDPTWAANINCNSATPCFSLCYVRPSSITRVTQSCGPATSIYIRCGGCVDNCVLYSCTVGCVSAKCYTLSSPTYGILTITATQV